MAGLLDRLDHMLSYHEMYGTWWALKADYPHCDSTWPHSQRTIHEQISGLPDDIIRKVMWENASRLYQHPVPVAVQTDPNAF